MDGYSGLHTCNNTKPCGGNGAPSGMAPAQRTTAKGMLMLEGPAARNQDADKLLAQATTAQGAACDGPGMPPEQNITAASLANE